jgi:hypothetical protein
VCGSNNPYAAAAHVEVLKHNAIHHRHVKLPRRLTATNHELEQAILLARARLSIAQVNSFMPFLDDRTLCAVAVGEP